MQETQKPRKDTQYLQAQIFSPRDATHPLLLADSSGNRGQRHWDSTVKGLRENLSTKAIAANYQVQKKDI